MKTLKIIACLILLILSPTVFCRGSVSADSVTILIKISDPALPGKSPQLSLQRLGEQERLKIDPVSVVNGLLQFSFINDDYFECILNFRDDPSRAMLFFLSPGSKKVQLNWDLPAEASRFGFVTESSGSAADSDFRRFQDSLQRIHDVIGDKLTKKYADYQGNYERPDIVNERNLLYDQDRYMMMTRAIKDKRYYTPVLYWNLMQGFDSWSVEQLKVLLALEDPGAGLYYKKQLEADLVKREAALKGEDSRNALFQNAELAEALKNSKKKFIYLSLWASWCGPCRAHHKELLTKDLKDVEVIAVSFDAERLAMNKAVIADGIGNWKQVQLADGINSELAKAFNISALPSNIVLNEKRKVIGINISEEKLLYDLK